MQGLIFLKKIYIIITLALSALITVTGCTHESPSSEDSSVHYAPAAVTEPETEPPTEAPTEPPADTVVPQEGVYVYDNADILSDDEESELNSYLSVIYNDYLINPAVVTADHIGGHMPYTFATDMYDTIYAGKGSGILLLINNDTNTDSMYRTGSCTSFITDDEERKEFYLATQKMMSGNFPEAIHDLMALAEKCPRHVFDNIGHFSTDDANALENRLSECKEEVSLLITSNGTDTPSSDICRQYCQRKYPDNDGYMIMIDIASKSVLIESGKEMPEKVGKALDSAKKSAEKENYAEAVDTIIQAF